MPSKTTKTTKKKTAAPTRRELTDAERLRMHRMWSSVLFVVGVFVLFITYIKGESLWLWLHNALRGLFGISAVLLAPTILYVAVMLALDRSKSAVITKVIQGAVLMLLLSPAFEIFYCIFTKSPVYEGGFVELISNLYENGKQMHGGGALGIIIGGTLAKLCGTAGALIIIILLILLSVMLLTNLTFIDIWHFFARQFRSAGEAIRVDSAERAQLEAEREQQRALEEKNRKEKRVDIAKFIPDDDKLEVSEELPQHPVVAQKTEEKPEKKKKKSFFDTFDDPEEPKKAEAEPVETIDETIEKTEEKAEDKPIEKPVETPSEKPEDKPSDKSDDIEITPISEALEMHIGVKQEDIAPEPSGDIVNPIYVDEDGQTSLFEGENSVESGYNVPPIDLLNPAKSAYSEEDTRMEIQQNSETLVETLRSFGVTTRLIDTHRGPSVTRYELQPAAGVKVSKITNLADDIALNLAAEGVRIEAPIPGKAAVGIELANKTRDTVYIRELIDSDEFRNQKSKLGFPVGKNIEGNIICGDIAKMPHLLIAGTTGSGKSVFTNSIIMSILYNASPDEVKLILVDPKQVEFPIYNGIPHLLIPVVTEARKAAGALGWAVTEMMKRYKIFSDNGVRDLGDYNKLADEKDIPKLPKIVIVVDELADLMMAASKEVEESICRIAQLARAAGMHLVIATQSPRADIVTGLIKANIPSRVALKVSNQTDSRVILDFGGAEKLLGNGDLLYMPVGVGKPTRIQGSYVATEEIRRVVDFLKAQTASQYDEDVATEIEKHIPVPKGEKQAPAADAPADNGQGDMIERAIEHIVRENVASTTFLQRRLKLGYARAARIMDELEEMGVVGPADGAKPREIRMTKEQWLERKTSMGGTAPNIELGADDR